MNAPSNTANGNPKKSGAGVVSNGMGKRERSMTIRRSLKRVTPPLRLFGVFWDIILLRMYKSRSIPESVVVTELYQQWLKKWQELFIAAGDLKFASQAVGLASEISDGLKAGRNQVVLICGPGTRNGQSSNPLLAVLSTRPTLQQGKKGTFRVFYTKQPLPGHFALSGRNVLLSSDPEVSTVSVVEDSIFLRFVARDKFLDLLKDPSTIEITSPSEIET